MSHVLLWDLVDLEDQEFLVGPEQHSYRLLDNMGNFGLRNYTHNSSLDSSSLYTFDGYPVLH